MTCVLPGARGVAVERDFQFDHVIVGLRARPGGGQSFGDLGQQRLGIELPLLAAGADEAVARPAGVAGDQGAGGGDIDRHLGCRAIVDGGLRGTIVLALEAHPLLAPQRADQGHRLAHPGEALLELRPGLAGRGHLVQRFAGADAQDHAPREHRAQGAKGLGDDRGVVAEGGGEHAGSHHQPRGSRTQRAQPGERERRMAIDMLPGLEVVADEGRIEARGFGLAGEV